MIPMCSPEVRERLLGVLASLGLPTRIEGDPERMLDVASHDKKCEGGSISVVYVREIGSFEIQKKPVEEWKNEIRRALEGEKAL
jgi:3-dehydroquinate synthase